MKWVKRDEGAPTDRADFILCWVKDLLDPSIKQTREILHDAKTGGFCCLGVACQTAGLEKMLNVSKDNYYYDGECKLLPNSIASFLKMDYNGGIIDSELYDTKKYNSNEQDTYNRGVLNLLNSNTSLTEANDKGITFYKIAKSICSYPKSFFENLTEKEEQYIVAFSKSFPNWGDYRETRKAARAAVRADKGTPS